MWRKKHKYKVDTLVGRSNTYNLQGLIRIWSLYSHFFYNLVSLLLFVQISSFNKKTVLIFKRCRFQEQK
jgi:hypothetical protein